MLLEQNIGTHHGVLAHLSFINVSLNKIYQKVPFRYTFLFLKKCRILPRFSGDAWSSDADNVILMAVLPARAVESGRLNVPTW